MADHFLGHLTRHAENQGNVTNIHGCDNWRHKLDLNLDWMSDDEIGNMLSEITVNTQSMS